MKITFSSTSAALALLALSSLSSLYAKPEIRWRHLPDGTIKVQVQDWQKETAPVIKLNLVDTESYELQESEIVLPELTKMKVKGSWQLASWSSEKVPEGIYLFGLQGEEQPEEITEETILKFSETYQVTTADLNHQLGNISWMQQTPGVVSILFQFPSGLVLDRQVEWKPYATGRHTIEYDYVAADGVDYRYQPNLRATAQYVPFASNIFVQGHPAIDHPKLPEIGESLEAKVTKIDGEEQDLLRVELTPETLKQMGSRRYEIVIYADGVFVHEEAQGVSPYTYIIPETISSGAKQLTVNLIDYDGGWGVSTIDLSK